MIDEFIHWPKPYLFLSSICDEILSWRIKYLVRDNIYNAVNLYSPSNNVRLTFSVGLQSVLSKTIRIGDTIYHI